MRIDPTIKGRVVDSAGQPIKNIKVFPSTEAGKRLPGIDAYGRTDEQGNYTFQMPTKSNPLDPTGTIPVSAYITAESIIGYKKTTKKVTDALNSSIVMAKPGEEAVVEKQADQTISADQTNQAPDNSKRNMIIGIVLVSLSLVAFFVVYRLVRKQ